MDVAGLSMHVYTCEVIGCEFIKRWRNAAGVDEQIIAEKTGHRSSSVRAYKRISISVSYKRITGSVKFYMEVIEEVIVERNKLKKLRMKKRKRAWKFELKQEI